MSVSFGNFKLNEIYELIGNKDPLHLNTDIDSYPTIKNNKSEANLAIDAEESKMEHDAIPHYLKLAANFNNNTDTNKEKENTSPYLQVNNPVNNPINSIINRPLHSVSSGNLA